MNAALRAQLRDLDRALLALLDERARLLAEVEAEDPGRTAAVDDMLRRHDGPFPAQGVAAVFRAVDAHCTGFARTRAAPRDGSTCDGAVPSHGADRGGATEAGP